MIKLLKDKRYRVQFFPPGSKQPHEMIAQYMGNDNRTGSRDDHYFNLRPFAGTTMLNASQIIAVFPTEQQLQAPKKL